MLESFTGDQTFKKLVNLFLRPGNFIYNPIVKFDHFWK